MVMCFVPDCKHYSERKTCSFFRFPKDPVVNRKWISLISEAIKIHRHLLWCAHATLSMETRQGFLHCLNTMKTSCFHTNHQKGRKCMY
nr:unnamed protein product [Callosobruchus analis]